MFEKLIVYELDIPFKTLLGILEFGPERKMPLYYYGYLFGVKCARLTGHPMRWKRKRQKMKMTVCGYFFSKNEEEIFFVPIFHPTTQILPKQSPNEWGFEKLLPGWQSMFSFLLSGDQHHQHHHNHHKIISHATPLFDNEVRRWPDQWQIVVHSKSREEFQIFHYICFFFQILRILFPTLSNIIISEIDFIILFWD